jgi:hypothetical protein
MALPNWEVSVQIWHTGFAARTGILAAALGLDLGGPDSEDARDDSGKHGERRILEYKYVFVFVIIWGLKVVSRPGVLVCASGSPLTTDHKQGKASSS